MRALGVCWIELGETKVKLENWMEDLEPERSVYIKEGRGGGGTLEGRRENLGSRL